MTDIAEHLATVARILAELPTTQYRRDPRDEFEPVAEDWSDYGHEGADRLEARETRWLAGES